MIFGNCVRHPTYPIYIVIDFLKIIERAQKIRYKTTFSPSHRKYSRALPQLSILEDSHQNGCALSLRSWKDPTLPTFNLFP